jgi:hypothetical protein
MRFQKFLDFWSINFIFNVKLFKNNNIFFTKLNRSALLKVHVKIVEILNLLVIYFHFI